MKLFFISDIHGSSYYLEKVINIYEKEKADYLVILGDELYHGARNPLPKEYNPKKVAEILNKYKNKIIAVRGNCDSEVDQMVLNYPIMSDYSIILYNNRRLFLTHGHIYNKNNLPTISNGDVFIYGHTHVPLAKRINNIFIINPGSITFPKENTPHCYGILENNTFIIKTLDGEVFKEINIY
ncbi:phosphodiesterase [Clostridium tetani]|uniref:Phosphoesterase n=1 Tax=Clostridium tetani (strain Massachusetts / E88) TaxID=212717 RepID=Q893K3_CLOTE|nr:phosphodiesterase [Clostridium tetani]AAO36339.1 putative phosphoesterase [Clostridium tetani E88]KGI37697.1 phosphodiesterase [Clostridium tetani]KGI39623.1 phosphodiesterase [Clostridium tetani ATCC 9441]KGI45582.1 phosphodiesterase [Clostridium tetani]KHO31873.1 phosphodiesterase [Clostridium tetani]